MHDLTESHLSPQQRPWLQGSHSLLHPGPVSHLHPDPFFKHAVRSNGAHLLFVNASFVFSSLDFTGTTGIGATAFSPSS